ncbi:UNVERIFIED_CONTAM: hypothetical protein Scaly_2777400 [Sesamum calycinum]|uniref:Retrotransposon gag domain-containing protein n=1 Tax=Sesamum calycinum TaxID=2727403 RepID=A0AAW2IY27_9LAMI
MPTSSEFEEEFVAQNPERTINEMTSPYLNQQPLCIEYPTLDVDFELKSGLIHLLPTFRGLAGEDPHKYLKEFHVVCSGIRPQRVTEEYESFHSPWAIKQKIGSTLYLRDPLFKQFVESCPHHQIPNHRLIQYFYEGFIEANRSLIDAASGGALYDKTPTESRKLITTMAANNQQFGSRNDNPPRRVYEVRTSIDEHLDSRTSLVEHFILGNTQQVKACGICTSLGHATDACPTLKEEPTIHANAVGGFSGPSQRGHDPFSNTYNPRWRDHPNLRYGNQPHNSQRPPYQQPPPPQTNSNSGHSSKYSKFRVSSEPISLLSQSFGVPRCLCLNLPSRRFSKSKKKEEERKILETLRKVEVNIPLLDAIKQVPRYAKFLKLCTNKSKLRGNERVSMGENVSAIFQRKLRPKCKDLGAFSMPCKIGNIGIEKAMCDSGASINVMPLAIYESLNIGPLKETGVVIQFADRSVIYPEGVLEDVLVQVNELVFPADFYVLDMTENTSPNSTSILLGIPFLKPLKSKLMLEFSLWNLIIRL